MAVIGTVVEGGVERRIVIALIVNKSILGRVSSKWDGKLFRSSVSNLLASLCIDFYKKHSEAPGKAIDSIYESWAETHHNQRQAEEVGRFLADLDGEYQQLEEEYNNPEVIIDLAGKHLDEVRQERFSEDIQAALQLHDTAKVNRIIEGYRKVELGIGAGLHPVTDEEEVKSVFNFDHSEVLVEYPGALGEFFGVDFARDQFVVFEGSAKSTKSFFLQDVAWRAMLNRKRVAYFEAGDLSRRQVERRFLVRAANWPWLSTNMDRSWPCTVRVPVSMEVGEHPQSMKKRGWVTKWREKEFYKPLDFEESWKACQKIMKERVRSNEAFLKLSVHSNDSLTIDDILSCLDGWAAEGWQADIVVLDYIDIMARPKWAKDDREAINATWKAMKKITQDYHILCVTATQADADSYTQELLKKKNFSGDRRKHDHVNAMYGINRMDDEVAEGMCRLNVIDRRDGEAVTNRCIYVAQCLPLGDPAVLAKFWEKKQCRSFGSY